MTYKRKEVIGGLLHEVSFIGFFKTVELYGVKQRGRYKKRSVQV